jgi:hypothetical protein
MNFVLIEAAGKDFGARLTKIGPICSNKRMKSKEKTQTTNQTGNNN